MWQRIRPYEPYFFSIVVLLHLYPLFSGSFFPTLDAPAHLYNARLINDLLFGAPDRISEFFALNSEPVPNWTGHSLLAFFKSFLPAYIAEKTLLILYAFGLAHAFRYLLASMPDGKILFAYLLLPFIYHELFLVGFYNFCLGLTFLFWTLGYYQRLGQHEVMGGKVWGLFLLGLLTYFSHVFAFATLLLYLLIERVHTLVRTGLKGRWNIFRKISYRWNGELLLALCLPAILMLVYFLGRPITGEPHYLPFEELMKDLGELAPLIGKSEDKELPWTKGMNYGLIVLLLIGIYGRIRRFFATEARAKERKGWHFGKASDHWGLGALVLLTLYFLFPNSNGSAGVISPRFSLLFFLFLILWISTLPFPRKLLLGMALLVLYPTFRLDSIYVEELAPLQETAWNAYEMSHELEKGSIVLPVRRSREWDHHHFSNYLGVEGSAVILENYEANKGYFPIIWNEEGIPDIRFGKKRPKDFSCIEWKQKDRMEKGTIDYVLILGLKEDIDSCHREIDSILENSYEKVEDTPLLTLYKRIEGQGE